MSWTALLGEAIHFYGSELLHRDPDSLSVNPNSLGLLPGTASFMNRAARRQAFLSTAGRSPSSRPSGGLDHGFNMSPVTHRCVPPGRP